MNPVGIALAFLVLWSLGATGVMLAFRSAAHLRHSHGFWLAVYTVGFVLGLALAIVAIYATKTCVYGFLLAC
jgi:galactitol-specific phosphotransferase system IIC component